MISLKELMLNEFSEKTIQTTIERWKQNTPTLDNNTARQTIQRFDQIKSSLTAKLNQVALSDELKQSQNYLNIDKYNWGDMIKLIQSLPEKEDKIKKDAINKFISVDKAEKTDATSYVNRFFNKKREIKYALSNGTEDENYTSEQVKQFIPRQLIPNDKYLDPRLYTFRQIEILLDTLFPVMGMSSDNGVNSAETDADRIYNKDGIEIYKGDAKHKCVNYNPNKDGRKKYSWCISQPGNSMYDSYRIDGENSKMFYFVFNRNLEENDKYHAFVIHVGSKRQYQITSAQNDQDKRLNSWNDLKQYPSAWNAIGDKENLFKFISPSKAEISSAALKGKKLNGEDFIALDYETKELYVLNNAGVLSEEILNILDKDLTNLAINNGQAFTYNQLKKNEQLVKRYAIYRFRHTNYENEAIPLPFIKYLDDSAKKKYLEKFDDELSFNTLKKYFGDQVAKDYVDKESKQLGYLPKEAIPLISDSNTRNFYNLYNKLTKNWKFSSEKETDEVLENSTKSPEQTVATFPMTQEDWKELSLQERKIIAEKTEEFNNKSEYIIFLMAVPYIVKNAGEKLFLIPSGFNKDNNCEGWALMDINANIIYKLNNVEYIFDEISSLSGNIDGDKLNKIIEKKDIKPVKELNEVKIISGTDNRIEISDQYDNKIKITKLDKIENHYNRECYFGNNNGNLIIFGKDEEDIFRMENGNLIQILLGLYDFDIEEACELVSDMCSIYNLDGVDDIEEYLIDNEITSLYDSYNIEIEDYDPQGDSGTTNADFYENFQREQLMHRAGII